MRHVPATSSTQQNNTATKLLTVICSLKDTVPRDFLLQVFFINQFPPGLEYTIRAVLIFFRKFAEIFAAQDVPPEEKNLVTLSL